MCFAYPGENAHKHGYQVIFDVTEYNRVGGGISTMVGTNEGSLVSSIASAYGSY